MLATIALVTLTLAVLVQLGRHAQPAERRVAWRDLRARGLASHVRAGARSLNELAARR